MGTRNRRGRIFRDDPHDCRIPPAESILLCTSSNSHTPGATCWAGYLRSGLRAVVSHQEELGGRPGGKLSRPRLTAEE